MNELKFRCWNIERKDWDYFLLKVGEPISISTDHTDEIFLCTGLKDIKGADIYDGAVCKQIVDEEVQNGVVSTEITRGVMVGAHPIYFKTVEVMGDVYSTPELIK